MGSDIYSLIITVWKNKIIVLATVIVFILAGFAVRHFVFDSYQFSVAIRSLTPKQYDSLEKLRLAQITTISDNEIFDLFEITLKNETPYSNAYTNLITQDIKTISEKENKTNPIRALMKRATVSRDLSKSRVKEGFNYSYIWPNEKTGVQIVDYLIDFADQAVTSQIIADVQNQIAFLREEYEIEKEKLQVDVDQAVVRHQSEVKNLIKITNNDIKVLNEYEGKRLDNKLKELGLTIKGLKSLNNQNLLDEIEDIESNIKESLDEYNLSKNDRITYLKEQAAISNALGIAELKEWSKPENSSGETISLNSENEPYFFRGTIAINEEINQLNNRTDDEAFVPRLRPSQTKLNDLNDKLGNDSYVEELRNVQNELFLTEEIIGKPEFTEGLLNLQEQLTQLNLSINEEYVENIGELKQLRDTYAIKGSIDITYKTKLLKDFITAKDRFSSANYNLTSKRVNPPPGIGITAIMGILLGIVFGSIAVLVKSNHEDM